MRKIWLALILILLSSSIAFAAPSIYRDNGIAFTIPANWSIADVQQLDRTEADGTLVNDTKIVLTDNYSAIRIDIIKIPQTKWLMQMYEDSPYYVMGILESYYRTKLLEINSRSMGLNGGSGLSIKPDGVEHASFRTGSNGDLIEWIMIWTKPDYNDKFIGVHALFQGDYQMKPLSMSGGGPYSYYMQKPLYEILDSIVMNKTSQPITKESENIVSKV